MILGNEGTVKLTIEAHSLLNVYMFKTVFSKNTALNEYPEWLNNLFFHKSPAPVIANEVIRKSIRDLLRYGGYKPAGRAKPASEYLQKTVQEQGFPKINPIVDIGNIVSFHSGIPLSVIDLDLIKEPFTIRLGMENENYIFNSSGQKIDLKGLLCFCDVAGPCANPVKDSMRSKTNKETLHTITILWGTKLIDDQLKESFKWYSDLLYQLDNKCSVTLFRAEN